MIEGRLNGGQAARFEILIGWANNGGRNDIEDLHSEDGTGVDVECVVGGGA